MLSSPYRNRRHAGAVLATQLGTYANRPDVLILALPRGGVPIGYEVARAIQAPLDVFMVRKLGVPGQQELALGAIASGSVRVLNQGLVAGLGISDEAIDAIAAGETRELERRERRYRHGRPSLEIRGRTVILVDDGLATGASMRAAIAALRQHQPARIVVAVPIAAQVTCEDLRSEVDEMVCAATPEPFTAVGQWYEDFSQTTDEEVEDLLRQEPETLDQPVIAPVQNDVPRERRHS